MNLKHFIFQIGLNRNDIYKYYPNKFVSCDPERICVQHTLYEVPVSYVLACVVSHFSASKCYTV